MRADQGLRVFTVTMSNSAMILGLYPMGSFFYLSFLRVYSSYWLVTGVAWVVFRS